MKPLISSSSTGPIGKYAHLVRFLMMVLAVLTSLMAQAEDNSKLVRMATTTSTDNSGLLEYLLPDFESRSGYQVQIIATGTGKALRMGLDGDVDIVLVHAENAEQQFIESGAGVKRVAVMHNDFVVVGPISDPALLRQQKGVLAAMNALAKGAAPFVSRGDDSGTHKKELSLWRAANIIPENSWYREAGQGMGNVLQIAAELDAYTLTDRGTWLAYQDNSPLRIVYEGATSLSNPYSIIAVNPERHTDTNITAAKAMIGWITSEATQNMIAGFTLHGQQLFEPSAVQ